ncbi:Tbcc Domain-Containing Protein 1 [Manis pentadactyla]|nr:Tbcc Domain-Containing Protein 1 [Manis pentadactyla]
MAGGLGRKRHSGVESHDLATDGSREAKKRQELEIPHLQPGGLGEAQVNEQQKETADSVASCQLPADLAELKVTVRQTRTMITIQGSEFGYFHSHEISSLVHPTSAAHSVTTASLQGCALHITVISIPVIILSADWQADAQRDCNLPGHMAGGRQPGHEHYPARPSLAKLASFKPKMGQHLLGIRVLSKERDLCLSFLDVKIPLQFILQP